MAESAARVPPLRGLVLAGGHSTRLGSDKAAVLVQGRPLIERVVAALAGVVADVRVAVRPDQLDDSLRGRFALVPDVAAGIGPAAGILAAHRLDPGSAWLVVACDMPRVTQGMLATLVKHRDPGRPATAFRTPADGRPEPLCAIYEPATLARFRRHVDAGGHGSPRSWLVAECPALLDAPEGDALGSINTPADLERLGDKPPDEPRAP